MQIWLCNQYIWHQSNLRLNIQSVNKIETESAESVVLAVTRVRELNEWSVDDNYVDKLNYA